MRRRRFYRGTLYTERIESSPNPEEKEYWFDEYIKPLPTWVPYDPVGYKMAYGRVVARPPSEKLLNEAKYLAGLIEADGYFGYIILDGKIFPTVRIVLHETDRNLLEEIGRLFNVAVSHRAKEAAVVIEPAGMRAYLIINLIHRHFKSSRRKESSKFLVDKGIWVTESELAEFKRLYKPLRGHTTIIPEEKSGEEVMAETWLIEPVEAVEIG